MANKIVLISDDLNFFDFIKSKLELRKDDELFTFDFNSILDKVHFLKNNVLIVNSENSQEKTLDLLKIFKFTPVIVTAFNDDEKFKKKCYYSGALDFITLLISDSEFRARLLPSLKFAGVLEKNENYRNLLINKDIIFENNEVFRVYEEIIDIELEKLKKTKRKAIFGAISPSDNSKLMISSNSIETIILNNIRKNDILMNYAPNKYFIFLYDTDLKYAKKLWDKINTQMPEIIYAGFFKVTNQNRQQLINEALNKLHHEINFSNLDKFEQNQKVISNNYNFKSFKQDFIKRVEQIIIPTFYQIQQKYEIKLAGVNIKNYCKNGEGEFALHCNNVSMLLKISTSGFAKVNIDIIYVVGEKEIEKKRISLDLEEFTSELLCDLIEQIILEFKGDCLK